MDRTQDGKLLLLLCALALGLSTSLGAVLGWEAAANAEAMHTPHVTVARWR